jgi:hypothetical protein
LFGKYCLPLPEISNKIMMERVKIFLKDNMLAIIGAIVGGIGGYFYWLKIGCTSGSCPITSSPVLSVIWGAVMGNLIFTMFKRKEQRTERENNSMEK